MEQKVNLDVPRKLLAKSCTQLDDLEKGCLKAFLCKNIWTNSRLHSQGLLDSPACAFCGKEDTIEHIIAGVCAPEAKELPQQLRKYFLQDSSVDHKEHVVRAAGYLQEFHLEPPTDEGGCSFWAENGETDPKKYSWKGMIFMDGICFKFPMSAQQQSGLGLCADR